MICFKISKENNKIYRFGALKNYSNTLKLFHYLDDFITYLFYADDDKFVDGWILAYKFLWYNL